MIKWIIERNIFPENESRLIDTTEGRIIWVTTKIEGPECSEPLDEGDSHIFYGSIGLGRYYKLRHPKVFVWLPDHDFDCSYYLPYFGGYAANNPHLLTEVGNFESLAKILEGVAFFVKQNSGYKHFKGQVYDQFFPEQLNTLFDHELLLLAPARKIGAEWRFVIKSDPDHEILTWSHYDGPLESTDGLLPFVEDVLKHVETYNPAPFWTLDIGMVDGVHKVIEVNSLLTAGWYDCDVGLIVQNVENYVRSLNGPKESSVG